MDEYRTRLIRCNFSTFPSVDGLLTFKRYVNFNGRHPKNIKVRDGVCLFSISAVVIYAKIGVYTSYNNGAQSRSNSYRED